MLERLRRGVVQLMRDLGKEDRLKLMLFNMQAARSVDFTTDEALIERAIKSATAGGGTSLLDTISVSLVSQSQPDRRHLIVFFTDGRDSISVTTPDTLTTVAQRTRATLTFVLPAAPIVVTSRGAGAATTSITSMNLGVGRGQEIYASLAKETGGSVLPVSPLTDLTATFRGILEGFRSTYVLYYNATGIERGGYHTLEVKVKREGAVVQARRGYLGG
jgi:VWFA-related protein